MKTIDVQGKTWLDKINGNSYFSALVTIDFGMDTQREYRLPFQYGYGSQYLQEAMQTLVEKEEIKAERYSSGGYPSLWSWCKDNGVILREHMQDNCKKADVTAYGKN